MNARTIHRNCTRSASPYTNFSENKSNSETAKKNLQMATLHERLMRGDQNGIEDLLGKLLILLKRRLASDFPNVDPVFISDGITSIVLRYLRDPAIADTNRSNRLDRFLQWAAHRNVCNLLRGEARRKRLEEKHFCEFACHSVELCLSAEHIIVDDNNIREQQLQELAKDLARPLDRALVRLWLDGERRTEPFASLLGLGAASLEVQRSAVKRHKDRIIKIMQRAARKRGWLAKPKASSPIFAGAREQSANISELPKSC